MEKIKGVSFFCPAYYDGENVAKVIHKAVQVLSETCENYEIIAVNDGSPDNTGDVLDKLAAKYQKMRVIHHVRNFGYAAALRTGFKHAQKFEFILFTDGDDQYDVGYFREMVPHLKDYDAVISYRVKNGNNLIRRIISWIFNRVLNVIFQEPYRDLSSSFRLVKKSALNRVNLESKGIFLPVELVLKLHKEKFKIKEIPIRTKKRLRGRSSSMLPKNFIGAIIEMIKLRIEGF